MISCKDISYHQFIGHDEILYFQGLLYCANFHVSCFWSKITTMYVNNTSSFLINHIPSGNTNHFDYFFASYGIINKSSMYSIKEMTCKINHSQPSRSLTDMINIISINQIFLWKNSYPTWWKQSSLIYRTPFELNLMTLAYEQ